MSRKFLIRAVVVGVAFVLWTAVVHIGISHGSRHSVWIQEDFGNWPTTVDHIDNTSNIELAIFASFAPGPGGDGPNGSTSNIVGWAGIGTTVDSGDSNSINGSRVEAPLGAGAVTAMSVYVAGPVDARTLRRVPTGDLHRRPRSTGPSARDERDGAPRRRRVEQRADRRRPATWASYWLMYNTNGRTANMNNPTFRRVSGNPLDNVLQSQDVDEVAFAVEPGHPCRQHAPDVRRDRCDRARRLAATQTAGHRDGRRLRGDVGDRLAGP